MLKIILSGCNGKMGRVITRLVNDDEYVKIVAGFDIADFRMYALEILEKPYMLDVDYLIFGYDMSDDGIVTIKDVWLKKVWQITRRMENYPINLQVKEGVIHKIRPGVWYSGRATDYAIFECLEDFISAIEETTFKEPTFLCSRPVRSGARPTLK